jgi:hypothetical protein
LRRASRQGDTNRPACKWTACHRASPRPPQPRASHSRLNRGTVAEDVRGPEKSAGTMFVYVKDQASTNLHRRPGVKACLCAHSSCLCAAQCRCYRAQSCRGGRKHGHSKASRWLGPSTPRAVGAGTGGCQQLPHSCAETWRAGASARRGAAPSGLRANGVTGRERVRFSSTAGTATGPPETRTNPTVPEADSQATPVTLLRATLPAAMRWAARPGTVITT